MRLFYLVYILFFLPLSLGAENRVYDNYGIVKGNVKGEIYLTIDLCPSSKDGFEESLFLSLVELSKKRKQPINIAIAISGRWLESHLQEFNQIKEFEDLGYLKITWVNHSYRHYFDPSLPLENNFMLHDVSTAKEDLIKNYKVLASHGVALSNFIRFPGLISNDYLNKLVQDELKLHILGANAWLVKTNGHFSDGDIILLHGNLNEPEGIEIFLKLLKQGAFEHYHFGSIESLVKTYN